MRASRLPRGDGDHLAIVASTAGPAFAVDMKGRIRAWNEGAEELFGYSLSKVLGRDCWEVLSGRDIHGNDYCGCTCPLLEMARHRKAIHPSELLFRTATGEEIRLCVISIVVPNQDPRDLNVVHVLGPSASAAVEHGACPRYNTDFSKPKYEPLTPREEDVLRLIARGLSTVDAARELGVSAATVRNHMAKVMHKLRVHTRLQAVNEARRLEVID